MNNFLAVDTSSRYLTVLAVKDGKPFLRHLPDCAMRHSVMLMDEIDKTLTQAGLTPAECGFFCAVTGPGSFTGIRIGISAMKGFALGTGKKLKPVTSFDLIAYNVADENFYVCIDAAHEHYYVCGYGKNLLEPCYLSKEEVSALDAPKYGFEDLPLENYRKLDAGAGLYPAVCACDNLSDEMSAQYVRKSQAEENLK